MVRGCRSVHNLREDGFLNILTKVYFWKNAKNLDLKYRKGYKLVETLLFKILDVFRLFFRYDVCFSKKKNKKL